MKFFKRSQPDTEPASDASPAAVTTESRPGWLARLRAGLGKTRHSLTEGLATLFLGRKTLDDDLFEELETRLLLADVGVATTREILDALTRRVRRKELNDPQALYAALKEELLAVLRPVSRPLALEGAPRPYVILMVGVNGAGKTTTIGKLARRLRCE